MNPKPIFFHLISFWFKININHVRKQLNLSSHRIEPNFTPEKIFAERHIKIEHSEKKGKYKKTREVKGLKMF